MGLIKEYVDRAIQTDLDQVPSPYVDPAVVLAAPPLTRSGLLYDAHTLSSPAGSDSARALPRSPTSPIMSPLASRRLYNRRYPRCPPNQLEAVNRRIVSMPETRSETLSLLSQIHGKRIVSMPNPVRPELDPPVEIFHSPSTSNGDSFGSCGRHRERVHIFRTPSDIPQTPSPPSSPESLLIIAAGTQLPDGFLRRKYSPESLIEEDEDWITWANSPPRPIPALHGPLSLPYARCPSGAEGTIIEEPDNMARMIWGLGPDDPPHTQHRAEGISSHVENFQYAPSHGPNQGPSRSQKRRGPTLQVSKSSRTQVSAHMGHAKPNLSRTQRQAYVDEGGSQSQVPFDIEVQQDTVNGFPWNEAQSMPTTVGIPDNLSNDGILEWQIARLQQALRTSLADMDSYSAYPGRLEPIIPASVVPGLSQSYPRIFVEPRPNEALGSSPIEIAQQYRQQLYRQALQKQKMQTQNILPTPPNSSSPQWSSRFSPYLSYRSTFSPESIGSSVPLQKHRSATSASQYLRNVYERREHDNAGDFDTISPARIPQSVPNVNSATSVRQNLSSSSTLAKYIKQLQALSPLQSAPPTNDHSPLLCSTDQSTYGPLRSLYHSPAIPTPPSPESPQALSRRSLHHSARSIPSERPMQRRLSSVPEEDSAVLELSTSVSPSRLQSQVTSETSHDGHQSRYLEVPCTDINRKSDKPESEGSLGTPSIAFHPSPVKVRLPAMKDHNTREQTGGYHPHDKEGHQHGHRKKHRYKKLKGLATTNRATPTQGLVG